MRFAPALCIPIAVFLHAFVGCSGPQPKLPAPAARTAATPDTIYENRRTAEGTGRFYMGREIAPVMGHEGLSWLERPEREREERTDLLIGELRRYLKPSSTIADLGAGSGYFTFRLALLVARGAVLAVDIQPEMLEEVRRRAKADSVTNVHTVLCTETDPRLPADSVDLVLVVDAYHEFSYPREVMTAVVRALRTGGYVALVEYRAEDPTVPIKPRHKMSEAQARREMAAVGLQWVQTSDKLPQQHLMFFRKP